MTPEQAQQEPDVGYLCPFCRKNAFGITIKMEGPIAFLVHNSCKGIMGSIVVGQIQMPKQAIVQPPPGFKVS